VSGGSVGASVMVAAYAERAGEMRRLVFFSSSLRRSLLQDCSVIPQNLELGFPHLVHFLLPAAVSGRRYSFVFLDPYLVSIFLRNRRNSAPIILELALPFSPPCKNLHISASWFPASKGLNSSISSAHGACADRWSHGAVVILRTG